MKLVSKQTLLAAMLAAASVGAFAADSVDLKIIGTIVPPSCTPTLSGGGIVDYGNIPAASVTASSLVLNKTAVSLTVTCDAPTRVAFTTTDNRSGSAAAAATQALGISSTLAFGLGQVSGKSVGSYQIIFAGGTADGHSVSSMRSGDQGANWQNAAGNGYWAMNSGARLHSLGDYTSTVPGAYTTSTWAIEVQAALNTLSNLPDLKQEVPLDGLATFSLVYL